MMMKSIKFIFKNTLKNIMVVYLHGGPNFNLNEFTDDPFLESICNKKINTFAINYDLCKGYGGVKDIENIKRIIKTINLKYRPLKIFVIGESYGGYLASLLVKNSMISKIISISGFVSIQYQLLFSTERYWLKNYISPSLPDYVSIQEHHKVPITFINGGKDKTIPIFQFNLVKTNSNTKIIINLKCPIIVRH
jgi:dipeptidyl aminopeptidase/acylaminoacyl peptidase